MIGNPKGVRKVGELILIETVSNAQSAKFQEATEFAGTPVKIEPQGTMSTSRGTIRCEDLLNVDLEEICTELEDQGVIDLRRIMSNKNGKKTATVILTFNTP